MRRAALQSMLLGVAVSVVHLAFMLYLLSRTVPNRTLQVLWDVLSFPLVYVERFNYRGAVPKALDFDWAAFLVVGNSLLWGVVAASVWFFWIARHETP